jgi:hypothetical protein
MKIEDIVQGIVVGVIFTCAGFAMTFRKKKFIDALLSSNKVFWEKMNYSINEDRNRSIANIMIPLMGLVFLAAGIFSVFKVIVSLSA